MPKIRWTDLPLSLRQHLFDRVADRQITAADLYKLKLWRESGPDAPGGPWYKDLGSFKICGEGEFPKTFLLKAPSAVWSTCLSHPGRWLCLQPGWGLVRESGKPSGNPQS
jgi:hypothetical protein